LEVIYYNCTVHQLEPRKAEYGEFVRTYFRLEGRPAFAAGRDRLQALDVVPMTG
jgi:hypothetical protein